MTLAEASLPPDVQLIGGEMLAWSDAAAPGADNHHGRPPVQGPALAQLVTSVIEPGARVLIAGPHHRRLVDAALAGGARISYLLRAYPDAVEVARTYVKNPSVEVVCGSLARFTPEKPYDVVIALDGVDRLCTVEGEAYRWDESLDALLQLISPGGVLMLSTENHLGVHSLVTMAPAVADREDGAWRPLGEFDLSAPRSLASFSNHLTTRGGKVDRAYGVFPLPHAPVVLASSETLSGRGAPLGDLEGVVSAACARVFAGHPVLSDPRRLAGSAVRAGLGAEFAAGWVLLARKEPVTAPRILPELIVGDGTPDPARNIVYDLVRAEDGGWRRRLSAGERITYATHAENSVVLVRDPQQVAGPVASGSLLETVLISASLNRDLTELRRLLRRYATWLTAQADEHGQLSSSSACASPHAVVLDGEQFQLIDPSWVVVGSLPVDLVLTRGLRQFAVDLIGGGFSLPWPSVHDADSLTIILTSMAGLPADRTTIARAVEVEADFVAAARGLDDSGREQLMRRLSGVDSGSPTVSVDGHRELHLALQRQQQQVRHLQAQLQWHQKELVARERSLRRAERMLDLLDGSIILRVGRLLLKPARVAKRTLVQTIRRVRRARKLGRVRDGHAT